MNKEESQATMEPIPEAPESTLRGARPSAARTRRIVAGALERSHARPSWRVPALAFGTAVVVAAVGLTLRLRSEEGPEPTLQAGVVADATDVPLTLHSGGHEVRLEIGGELTAESTDRHATGLRVNRGAADFKVRHLSSGERFWVSAGDVTVEALGTLFTVALEGPCVNVAVSEGRVEARRAGRAPDSLGQGESRAYCRDPHGPEVLTDEERLIFGALEGLRQGGEPGLARAEAQLEEYEKRFPAGAYDEEALYYLARIEQRRGKKAEAQAAASHFLERYPNGRRAAELRTLLPSK